MYKSWKAYHTISALSHFYSWDFPQPFCFRHFYNDIIRNLFINKNSSEVVEIELEDETTNNGCYMSIKVFAPRLDVKIAEIIDIEKFTKWYSERFEVESLKREEHKNNKKTYSHNDGYTWHDITIAEVENDFDYILIQYKTGGW